MYKERVTKKLLSCYKSNYLLLINFFWGIRLKSKKCNYFFAFMTKFSNITVNKIRVTILVLNPLKW